MLKVIDEGNNILKMYQLQFTAKNVKKIASAYDAKIIRFNKEIKFATIKDNVCGRLLWIENHRV